MAQASGGVMRQRVILGADGRPTGVDVPVRIPGRVVGARRSDTQPVLTAKGQYTALGYRAAEQARKDGRTYTGGSEDRHSRYDRKQIVNQSRAFDRDNFLYNSIVKRAGEFFLGSDGFQLQARTPWDSINEMIEKELWPAFTEYPEVSDTMDWVDLQKLVYHDCVVAGDIGLLKRRDKGKLQVIEAERFDSLQNQAEQGIVKDQNGRVVTYYVADYSPHGHLSSASAQPIAARNMIFVRGESIRASQTRGMPALQQAFPQFFRINDILDAEAVAWQLLARFAVMVSKKDAAAEAWNASANDADKTGDEEDDDLASRVQELDWGLVMHGEPGEVVSGVSQNRPGQNFPQSIEMFLRLLGLPLGMPLEVMLIDYGDMNYSSARANMTQYMYVAHQWQKRLIRQFYQRVYKWKVGTWIHEGILPFRDGIFDHEWGCPKLPWIDPDKEARAYGTNLDRTLTTHSEALKSQNRERSEVLAERKAEIEGAIEIADEINKAHKGANVDWRIFAGLEVGKTQEAFKEMDNGGSNGEVVGD